jgi:hypothetical protein
MKKNKNTYRYLGLILFLSYLLIFELGHIRSMIIGMPFGIEKVDRQKHEIPSIPNDWIRFPKDNKLSATQIWLNLDSIYPRHYAKKIIMHNLAKSYKKVSYELDRYVLIQDKYYQTDLVIAINYNKIITGENFRYCAIEKIRRVDTTDYCFNWFNDPELIEEFDFEKAKEILKRHSIDYN